MGIVVCMSNINEYYVVLFYDFWLDKKMNKIEVIFNDNLVEFYDVWCEESLELMLWLLNLICLVWRKNKIEFIDFLIFWYSKVYFFCYCIRFCMSDN